MIDHDSTRERILDALLVLISSTGSDGVTVRTVAAAAGVSVGAVQHHFATKDALLIAGMERVDERFRRRLGLRLAEESTARDRLLVFCRSIACIDDDDLTDAIVWTAFAARGCTDATIRSTHAARWAETEDFTLLLLADAYPDSDMGADDAALLLAVVDGIAVARAAEQNDRMAPARALLLIEKVLDGLAGRVA